jgi:hypothetical protein
VPEGDHPWLVRLSDLDTGNILFETKLKTGLVNSNARYFVRFRLEVLQNEEPLFLHEYSAANRDVLIRFPVDTLGDVLAGFPMRSNSKSAMVAGSPAPWRQGSSRSFATHIRTSHSLLMIKSSPSAITPRILSQFFP